MNNLNKTLLLASVAALALAGIATTANAATIPGGAQVVAGDVDASYAFIPAAGSDPLFACVAAIDADGTSGFSPGDPVYLHQKASGCAAGDTVAVGDVRLNTIGTIYGSTYNAGSLVGGGDQDFSRVLTALSGAFEYFNADGSTSGGVATYTPGDIVYFHRCTVQAAADGTAGTTEAADGQCVTASGGGAVVLPGAVAVNDLVITGTNAFKKVAGAPEGLNNVLVAFGTVGSADAVADGFLAFYGSVIPIGATLRQQIGAFDGNGDGVYGVGDTLYLPVAYASAPASNDVRLTRLSTASGGTATVPGDVDIGYSYLATTTVTFNTFDCAAFIDADGISGYSPGDPVYLHQDNGGTVDNNCLTGGAEQQSVTSGDVRLNTIGTIYGSTYSAGTIVSGGDQDFSRILTSFTATGAGAAVLKFYNADGSAATAANTNDGFTPGDILVLSVLSGTTIQINDVVLTGPNAFKKVGSAIEGLNNGLVAFETSTGATTACDDAADKYALQNGDVHRIAVFDGSSDGRYGVGDTVYVPITALCVGGTAEPAAGNSPNVNDVRLTKLGTGSAGTVLVSGDVDVFYNLPASALAKALCAIDADGVSGVSSGDPVYMTTGAASCPTTLPVGAVRLNTIGTIYGSTYTAGTIVGGADQDFSRTLITFDDGTATFCYYNADGSTGYSMNDIVYASRTTCSATVTINDVVLSGPNAYKKVAGVAEGQNNALASSGFAAEVAFFDASGDNSAGLGDTFYLRTTSGATSPNILDIRLTPLNVCDTCVNITPTPTPTGTTVPPTSGGTTPPTSGGTVPPTSDGSSSASPTTGGKKQPGFELVALVAALGAALVLVRRKL